MTSCSFLLTKQTVPSAFTIEEFRRWSQMAFWNASKYPLTNYRSSPYKRQ